MAANMTAKAAKLRRQPCDAQLRKEEDATAVQARYDREDFDVGFVFGLQEEIDRIAYAVVNYHQARKDALEVMSFTRACPGDDPGETNCPHAHQLSLSTARERLRIALGLFLSHLLLDQRHALRIFSGASYKSSKSSPECLEHTPVHIYDALYVRDTGGHPTETDRWTEMLAIFCEWEKCRELADFGNDFDATIDPLNPKESWCVDNNRIHAILAHATILISLMKGFCKRANLDVD